MKIITLETCKYDKKITYECDDEQLKKEIIIKIKKINKSSDLEKKKNLYVELQSLLDLCDCVEAEDIEYGYDYLINEVIEGGSHED